MINIFEKYNIIKYNKTIFIVFMIVVLILLIHLYNCYSTDTKEQFISIRVNDKTAIINKNNHLIDYFPLYVEDLKYKIHLTNEYFIKDTNKSYANFITNLTRNIEYYKNKLSIIKYPFVLRAEKDAYYVDYMNNNKIIQTKVSDNNWENYDLLETHTIITIYNYDYNILNKIKSDLTQFDYLSFQVSDIKQDILYDRFNNEDTVNIYIVNSVLDNIINNYNNKKFKLEERYINEIYDIIKNKISIEQFNSLIKTNQIQVFFKNHNLGYIIDKIIENNIIISIENINERFIFIYNEDDQESKEQLLNLFRYIQNPENLQFLNDRLSGKLRYFKVPLNVLRIIIKFKQYLKIF
jgi:hypothetical protein